MAQQCRSDLDVLTEDDHARGCQGREYTCTCGYDERVADEIERLRLEIANRDAVVQAACRWYLADIYVHPVLSRAEAVKVGVADLLDAVQNYRSARDRPNAD